ncbi:spry domain containing socs box protein [Anaeramoeba flamelloides]|uniref:Spry domain containing socs box protein n=1 Tax=Anaeramoeba flamelloides TaxID=1746091 RepID=A0AAV8A1B1_9EUKA|nr:spry domain containing socs box protein [Anaeramoeba flamelloides]
MSIVELDENDEEIHENKNENEKKTEQNQIQSQSQKQEQKPKKKKKKRKQNTTQNKQEDNKASQSYSSEDKRKKVDISCCTALIPGFVSQDRGFIIEIETRNCYGEIIKSQDDDLVFSVEIFGPYDTMEEVIEKQKESGEFLGLFTLEEVGDHQIIVRSGSTDIEGSPFKIRVGHFEYFDSKSLGLSISNSNKTIHHNSPGFWSGAKGTLKLTEGKYYFNFKVGQTKEAHIMIGVVSLPELDYYSPAIDCTKSWLFYCHTGEKYHNRKLQQYGKSCTTGDTIEMKVDMDKKQLSFYKNSENFGVAFDSLPDTLVLAVDLGSLNDVVSLV